MNNYCPTVKDLLSKKYSKVFKGSAVGKENGPCQASNVPTLKGKCTGECGRSKWWPRAQDWEFRCCSSSSYELSGKEFCNGVVKPGSVCNSNAHCQNKQCTKPCPKEKGVATSMWKDQKCCADA